MPPINEDFSRRPSRGENMWIAILMIMVVSAPILIPIAIHLKVSHQQKEDSDMAIMKFKNGIDATEVAKKVLYGNCDTENIDWVEAKIPQDNHMWVTLPNGHHLSIDLGYDISISFNPSIKDDMPGLTLHMDQLWNALEKKVGTSHP